jgi:hypothetical protein
MFIPSKPLGLKDKAFMGESFYSAPNPPFGAVFTYYLKDEPKTKKKERLAEEKRVAEKGGDVFYPTWDALRAEAREEEPVAILTVTDASGHVVRRVTGPVKAGFNRVAWDLRYPAANPAKLPPAKPEEVEEDIFTPPPQGPLAMPGRYTVTLEKKVDGVETKLGEPVTFQAEVLGTASLPAPDRAKALEFERKVARLQRAVLGSVELAKEASKQIALLEKALLDAPAADAALAARARELGRKLKDLEVPLTGDKVVAKYQEPVDPSIVDQVQRIVYSLWASTSAPTGTQQRAYDVAAQAFAPVLEKLKALTEVELPDLGRKAEAAGAPWSSGRVPAWRPE